jgi:hypothetical protein
MSLYGDFFAHATDWTASTAEWPNARRSTMGTTDMDVLLGDSRIWHDR